jgi:DNA-binding phage protein
MDIEEELRAHLRKVIKGDKTTSVVGSEANVDYTQIYRFLNGQTQLRSGTLAKLCSYLGLTLKKIGDDQEQEPESEFQQAVDRAVRTKVEAIMAEVAATALAITKHHLC